MVAGLTFFWQLIRGSFLVTFFTADGRTSPLQIYFDVALIICAMTLAAFPALCAELFDRRRDVTLGILGVCTLVLLVDAATQGTGVLPLITALSSGVSFAVLTVCWGRSCAQRIQLLEYEMMPSLIALSFFLSFLIAVPTVYSDIDCWFYSFVPIISGTCWFLAEHGSECAEHNHPRTSAASLATPDDSMKSMQTHTSSVRLMVALCVTSLFVVISGLLVGILGDFDGLTKGSGERRFFETMAFAFVLVVLTYAAVKFPAVGIITWGSTLMLVLVGVLLAMAFQDSLTAMGADILTMGRRTVWFLLWLLIVSATSQSIAETTRNLAVFFAAMFGVSRAVIDFARLSQPTADMPGSSAFVIMLLVATSLIICAFVIIGASLYDFLTRQGYVRALDELTKTSLEEGDAGHAMGDRDESLRHRACISLGKKNRLTEREFITLEYLAMGHTMPHIAETLGVSQNTIRSHAKAIYRKMNLHSKQELIDVVDNQINKERLSNSIAH
jgi:DNA-binding CsgD family transcriptional regulator